MRELNFESGHRDRIVLTAMFLVDAVTHTGETEIPETVVISDEYDDEDDDGCRWYRSDSEMRNDPAFVRVLVDSDGLAADELYNL